LPLLVFHGTPNEYNDLNQTCFQSVPTADQHHWKNKLSLLTRRRSATQLSRETLRLNDFDIFAPKISAMLLSCHSYINNKKVMDVILGIWLT